MQTLNLLTWRSSCLSCSILCNSNKPLFSVCNLAAKRSASPLVCVRPSSSRVSLCRDSSDRADTFSSISSSMFCRSRRREATSNMLFHKRYDPLPLHNRPCRPDRAPNQSSVPCRPQDRSLIRGPSFPPRLLCSMLAVILHGPGSAVYILLVRFRNNSPSKRLHQLSKAIDAC